MTAEQLAAALRSNFSAAQCDEFIKDCARGLAGELRRRTVLRTPVGDYSGNPYVCAAGLSHKGRKVEGKRGGTLKSSWHNSRISKSGGKYTVTLKNNALSDRGVPYGIYVEFGDKLRPDRGHRMLTKSRDEVQDAARGYIEKKLMRKMRNILR